jgi:outer membrane receptor protein involved in Fe transport
MVPYVTQDPTTAPTTISVGNPNLKPEHANDYDLLYEHYLKPYGELQAGFFYKQLSQPIYYLADPYYEGTQYPAFHGDILDYIENGVNAKLYGVEFAYIQHLGFLPGAWSGFGIMANFSKTGSSAGVLPLRTDNPALQRQTPTMWNLSPSYDRGASRPGWVPRTTAQASISTSGKIALQHRLLTRLARIPAISGQSAPWATIICIRTCKSTLRLVSGFRSN